MKRRRLLLALAVAAVAALGVAGVLVARHIRTGAANAALLAAVQAGDVETVRTLLDAGADPNARRYIPRGLFEFGRVADDAGTPAVALAAWDDHWAVAELLLDRGAAVPAAAGEVSLLHEAVRIEATGFMRALLDRGVPVDAPAYLRRHDPAGVSPLADAVSGRKLTAAAFLLDRGADMAGVLVPDPTQSYSGKNCTPLGWMAGNGAVVRLLVERGLPVDTVYPDGSAATKSLLTAAAYHSDRPLVEFLLARGAAVGAKDGYGFSALYYATIHNQEIAAVLRKAGATKDW